MIINRVLVKSFSTATQCAYEIRIAQKTLFSCLMDKTTLRNKANSSHAVAMDTALISWFAKEIKLSETIVITTTNAKLNIVKSLSVTSSTQMIS